MSSHGKEGVKDFLRKLRSGPPPSLSSSSSPSSTSSGSAKSTRSDLITKKDPAYKKDSHKGKDSSHKKKSSSSHKKRDNHEEEIKEDLDDIRKDLDNIREEENSNDSDIEENKNQLIVIKDMKHLNKIKNQDGRCVFVDYTATWCGPCKEIAPDIEELAKKYTDVHFLKVDIDKVKGSGVTTVPTFKLYVDGKKKGEVVGKSLSKVKDLLKKYGSYDE